MLNRNVVHNVIFTFGLPLVRFWLEHAAPEPYARTFYDNGKRVRLTIDYVRTPDDTQPVRRVAGYIDEDDRIEGG